MIALKGAAKQYWDLGLPVVSVKEKRPLVQWNAWQSTCQTFEEFEAQPWDQADGFAVVCGSKGKNNLYFVAIDIDDPGFNLGLLRTTHIERTPGGGYHFLYWSRENAKGSKNSDLKVELLGQGNLVIMVPSLGYKRINDNVATEIENIREIFNNLIIDLGGKPKREVVDAEKLLKGVKVGERDNASIRLAVWYRKKGLSPKETYEKLLKWDQQNQEPLGAETIQQKVESAYKTETSYRFVFTDEEQQVVYTPFLELPDGRLCEQAFNGKEVFLLVYTPESGEVSKLKSIEFSETIFQPIDNEEVRRGLILLPSDIEEYNGDEALMKETEEFLNRWHEPTNKESRLLDVFYGFLTYIKDLVPQLPYRRMLAPWGRGKSAWLEALGWICYRGIILAGSDTDKAVVRRLNNWQGTALIDEADFGYSSLYAFMTKILNIGYDRKTGFYQRCDDDDASKVLTYNVFGPKLLATRKKYTDPALESRCLTSIGRQNLKPMPLFRMDTFLKEAQSLRNKLILWRFRNYHKIKQVSKKLENASIVKEIYGDGNISSRIKQIVLPLWLIGGDELKTTLQKLAQTIDDRMKVEDPDYLLELQAKKAVIDIINQNDEVNLGNILNLLIGEGGQKIYELPLSEISLQALVNEGYPEDKISRSEKISMSRQLKHVFETSLGFTIKIGRARSRVVQIPEFWVKPEDLTPYLPEEGVTKGDSIDSVDSPEGGG